MKIAIIHEYLNQYGGAERTLREILMPLFPDAVIFTIFHDRKLFFIDASWKIKTSFIQYLPKIKKYKFYFPLFPLAVKLFSLKEYDLIISSSHAFAKSIHKPKNALHICYCHSPMRYAWDLRDFYLHQEKSFFRFPIFLFIGFLRWWDKRNTKQVDYFIANSKNIQQRILKCYKKESTVIYSAVDCKKYIPYKKKEEYYLVVSRLIEMKRIDIAIRAFNLLNKKLLIIGNGRDEKKLKALANSNITFLGYLPDQQVIFYLQRAKALIFPGLEDFGMTPLEAQACGTPVIAFGKGGALETVLHGKTGYFFPQQTPESLIQAVHAFENQHFSPRSCRNNALRFDNEIFKKKLKAFVLEKYKEAHHD